MTTTAHPLAMVTGEEITQAVALVRERGGFGADARIVHAVLHEPSKAALAQWKTGDPVDREVRVLVVPGPELDMVEAVVSVTAGEIRSWEDLLGQRPALLFVEAMNAIFTTKEHPEYIAALERRGITDLDNVQIDPWPAGSFGYAAEADRRIARCISFLRETPEDNGYARPIEGLIVHFDLGRNEVIEVIDHGITALPPQHARYFPADHEPLRDDLKPLEITQPEGPSFTVDGNLVTWSRWSFRIGFDPYEGTTLHQITYDDHGRARTVVHRASVSEMVVPYAEPGELHGWKNAFDAGEWGLGRMTQGLTLGCDCLGEIHYFDATLNDSSGGAVTIPNAICMHEEDFGISWKHTDFRTEEVEVRRSRRLVVSMICTVGNYEYGFFWYFYNDASIEVEVKLSGVLTTGAVEVESGEHPRWGKMVAPGIYGPNHQHFFNFRLDMSVDGASNSVYEVDSIPEPDPELNPHNNAWITRDTLVASEADGARDWEWKTGRYWKIANPSKRNELGSPVAYKLVPKEIVPVMVQEGSYIYDRARFVQHNLWVTKYDQREMYAAGDYMYQSDDAQGLPEFVADDAPLEDTDVVLWYTLGAHHVVRPEDWPVMPCAYTGFHLKPVGFFDGNPALDLPPSPPKVCHSKG
jgi:primary-amine oxidase